MTKANGHDDISARMLNAAISSTLAMMKLFNMSIMLGKLPDKWEVSRVVPIPRKGNNSDPENY